MNGENQRNDQRLGNMDKDKKLCKTTLIAHILCTLRYHLKLYVRGYLTMYVQKIISETIIRILII